MALTRHVSIGLAAALLLAGIAPAALAQRAMGWDDYAAGNYRAAVDTWTAAAATGSANAQFGLAIAYDLGRGVPRDARRACLYYRSAGEGGISIAAFNMAVMLDSGQCGSRDATAAADWYARAAAAGHARAQYDLAQLYEAGDGVPRNPQLAVLWYRLASQSGLSAAAAHVQALAGAATPSPGTPSDAVPRPATARFPVGDVLADRGRPTAFVWVVPQQAGPVHTYLEVYALQGQEPREVLSTFTEQSALMVSLRSGAMEYAWRVSTVAPEAHRYVTGVWHRFAVAGTAAP